MATLTDIAQQAMDQYFQDYATDTSFFDVSDFKDHAANYYSTFLNTSFQASRKEVKADIGVSTVEIPSQWLIKQSVSKDDIKEDKEGGFWYVETISPIFAFDYDAFGHGLNSVKAKGNVRLRKVSNLEIGFERLTPVTNNIYYNIETASQINYTKNPGPHDIYFVPAVIGSDDNCVMADSMAAEVIEKTLALMFGAKNGGMPIDKLDDQSKNIQQQK